MTDLHSSSARLEGRLEGKYHVLRRLGEGGMGAIHLVRHRLLDELRVVKVLHPRHATSEELRERFVREARAAIRLRHPNVVQIHDFSIDEEGVGLIVMEYIPGVDLRTLIRAGSRPSLTLGVEIARQGLRALAYLHRHRFIHRDVSPDNLMLTVDVDGRPLVKLIDLGIAKHPADQEPALTLDGTFLGKFRYASPEHFQGAGEDGLGPTADLYSYGLVLYEFLTGVYPFDEGSTGDLVRSHLLGRPKRFADTDPRGRVPEELRRPILRALEKDRTERYPSADAFLGDLEALQSLHPLDESAVDEARSWVRQALDKEAARSGEESDSFQDRLDRNFGLEPTPIPPDLGPTTPTPASTPSSQSNTVSSDDETTPSTRFDPTKIDPTMIDPRVHSTSATPTHQSPAPAQAPKVQTGTVAAAAPSADHPVDFETLFAQATKAALLRDYVNALDLFERAHRLRPEDPRVAYNLQRLRDR